MNTVSTKPEGAKFDRLNLILVSMLALLLFPASAHAQGPYTYNWPNGYGDYWSTGLNWNSVPVSGSNTSIIFFNGSSGSQTENVNTVDIAGAGPNGSFVLNSVTFQGTGVGFNFEPLINLEGNGLDFVSGTAGTPVVNLSSNNAGSSYTPVTWTVNNNVYLTNNTLFTGAGSATFNFAGPISGAGSLTKAGTSTLTLSGSNSYTGGTIINAGVLKFASGLAISASGTIALNGGTLQYTAGTTATISSSLLTLGGTAAIDSSSASAAGLMIGPGAIALSNTTAMTLTLQGSNTGTSNILAGSLGNNSALVTSLVKTGAGTWYLTGTNSYTGGTVFTGSTSAGTLGGNTFGLEGNINTGTVAANTVLFDQTLSGSLVGTGTYAGIISGSGSVVKNHAGTVVFTGSNTYAGSTTVNGGTLSLNFGATGAPVNNVISVSSALVLGGGTLNLTGSSSATNTQTFAGVTLSNGASAITATQGGASSLSGTLGAITRSTGATVDFTLPATGSFMTTSTNVNGIIGGYATVSGTTWAVSGASGTNAITGLSSSSYTNDTWASGSNTTVTTSSTQASSAATNSLRFNASGSNTVTVVGTNTITSGGILVTANVGANNSTINGSTGSDSIAGSSGGDLVIIQNNTAGNLTINAAINDNGAATSLTKSGAGTLILGGANSYSGATFINGGTLQAAAGNASALGGGITANLTVNTGALFDMNGNSFFVGNLAGGGTIDSTGNTAASLVIGSGFTGTGTFSGIIQNSGSAVSLTKISSGTMVLTGPSTYTGATSIQQGALSINSISSVGSPAASALGAPTTAANGTISLGSGANTATLIFTGTTTTTDRVINLAGSSGGGILEADGSGPLTLSGSITNTGAAKTLTLQGSNIDSNTISGVISGNTSLNKVNAGTWTLSGANTYTGNTTIGTLTDVGGTLNLVGAGLIHGSLTMYAGVLNLNNTTQTISALNIGNNNSVAGNPLSINIGSGNLILGGNVTIETGYENQQAAITGVGGGTVTLDGTRQFNEGGGGTNGSLSISAIIQDGTLGASGITKTAGTYALNLILSGTNTYTGATIISNGAIVTNMITNGGTASGIGASSNAATNLILNGGGLTYNGGTTSTDRLFSTGTSGGTISASGVGPITFTNTGTMGFNGQTGARTFTLGGTNTGANTMSVLIADNGGLTALTKTGVGTWVLTGSNTYGGVTTINSGTLSVSFLANGGSISNTGTSSNAAANLVFGVGSNLGGSLQYTGSGTSTDRLFSISGTVAAVGATLDASGSGAVSYTNTGAVVYSGSTNQTRSLTLTGTNTGANSLAMSIGDNGTGQTSFNKTGVGSWTFSSSNNYSGATTISNGTLNVTGTIGAVAGTAISVSSGSASSATLNASSVNSISGTSSITFGATNGANNFVNLSAANNFTGAITMGNSANNVLTLSDPNAIANASSFTITNGAINLMSNTSGTFNTPGITFTALTVNVGDISSGSNNALTISGTVTAASNGRTLFVTGSNGYSLNIPNFSLAPVVSAGDTLSPSTANLTVGNVINPNASGTNTLILTGTATGNVISGSISNGTGTAITAVTESGTGVWTFSGSSNYTGATTVTSGTLIAGNTQALGASTAPLSLNGGTLDLATDTSITAYNTTLAASSTVESDKATPASSGTTQTLGTLSAGAFTLNAVAGPNVSGGSPVVAFGATTLNSTTGATTIFNPTTANITLASVTSLAASTKVDTLQLDGTSTANRIIGVIANSSSGTTALTKSNTSTWTLSGSNTYTGVTTISGGNLMINGNDISATGAVAVNGGGTLSGTGTVGGLVTLAGGTTLSTQGTINLEDGTIGTLTLNKGLTIGSTNTSSNLMFDLSGSLYDQLAVSAGAITTTGTAVISVDALSNLNAGNFILITGTAGLGTSKFVLSGTTLSFGGNGYTLSLASSTATQEILTVTSSGSAVASGTAYWQGAFGSSGTGSWATVVSGSTNFTSDAAGTVNTGAIPGAAINVKFTANSGSNLNTVLGQDFTINSLEFTGTSTTAGSSSVTIGGTNALTIIASGTNGNTAGNGITVDAGSAAHTISSNVLLGSSQTWTVNGSPLTVSGTVGGAFGLTKSGSGTLILSASDSYTGSTAVNSGILQVDGSLSGSSAVTVNAATLQGIGTVSGSVALTGSSTLASSGTLTLAQGFSVSGSANTLSNGTVSGNATQAAGSQFAVNGTLNGTDNMLSGASLSGNGSVGATTLNGNNNVSSVGTLTVASLGVNGTGNQIGSGTVNATGGTTLANNSGLAVNGTLGGSVTTGSGSVLSGSGTLTGALTVSAGAKTYPGSGTSAAVLTTDLTYSSGAVAEFGVFSGTTPHGGGAGAGTAYDQIVVTGSSSPQLQIGAGTASSQISSGTLGSAASGVTLTLSMSSAVFSALEANASGSYQGLSSNNTLNNYFVFSLGSGAVAGRFQSLDLIINGVDEGAQTILYGGTGYGRFGSGPGITNTIGDVVVAGQEFAISYTGNYGANSTIGGSDIVLTAIPEPGTWGMILSGFGMLIGFRKLRKRRVG